MSYSVPTAKQKIIFEDKIQLESLFILYFSSRVIRRSSFWLFPVADMSIISDEKSLYYLPKNIQRFFVDIVDLPVVSRVLFKMHSIEITISEANNFGQEYLMEYFLSSALDNCFPSRFAPNEVNLMMKIEEEKTSYDWGDIFEKK